MSEAYKLREHISRVRRAIIARENLPGTAMVLPERPLTLRSSTNGNPGRSAKPREPCNDLDMKGAPASLIDAAELPTRIGRNAAIWQNAVLSKLSCNCGVTLNVNLKALTSQEQDDRHTAR